MPTRSRREELNYKKYLKTVNPNDCTFCKLNNKDNQFISATKSFKIFENIFGYSLWDNQKVVDHLLVVPKQHIQSMSELNQAQSKELINILSEYEAKGYSVYSRTAKSIMKTVEHLHTHLIKTHGKKINFMMFLRKPIYIRIPSNK